MTSYSYKLVKNEVIKRKGEAALAHFNEVSVYS
jgi:hypothetical protein